MRGIRSVINLLTDPGARKSAFRALVFGRSYRQQSRRPGAGLQRPGPIRKIRKLFTTYPILTNALTYGTLCVGAEYCQQKLRSQRAGGGFSGKSSHSTPIDMAALKRYAAWGFVVIPPIYSKWYQWLDGAFKTSAGSHSLKVMVQKLFLDQFVLTPVIVVLFFMGMAAMEGQSSLTEECKTKFIPTFAADCCFWLPVQWFNFKFISPDLRVVFIGVTTFIWLNVLCFIKRLPIKNFAATVGDNKTSPDERFECQVDPDLNVRNVRKAVHVPANATVTKPGTEPDSLKFGSKDCLPIAGIE